MFVKKDIWANANPYHRLFSQSIYHIIYIIYIYYMVHPRILYFTPPDRLIHILFFLLLSMNDSIIIIKHIWVNVDSNVVEMSGQPPKDLTGGGALSMCTWGILLYSPPPSLLGGQIL